jgi:hypothetical protein
MRQTAELRWCRSFEHLEERDVEVAPAKSFQKASHSG